MKVGDKVRIIKTHPLTPHLLNRRGIVRDIATYLIEFDIIDPNKQFVRYCSPEDHLEVIKENKPDPDWKDIWESGAT